MHTSALTLYIRFVEKSEIDKVSTNVFVVGIFRLLLKEIAMVITIAFFLFLFAICDDLSIFFFARAQIHTRKTIYFQFPFNDVVRSP